jgi:hypothetical protein
MGKQIVRDLVEVGQQDSLFSSYGDRKGNQPVSTWSEQFHRRLRRLERRNLREGAEDDQGGDYGADCPDDADMARTAAELSKRVASIINAVAVRSHPITSSDVDVLKEVQGFLQQLAPEDEEELATQESADYLRSDGIGIPMSRRVRRQGARMLRESRRAVNPKTMSDDALLAWLRG